MLSPPSTPFRIILCLFFLSFFPLPRLHAQSGLSIEQRMFIEQKKRAWEKKSLYFKIWCKGDILASIDWSSFLEQPDLRLSKGINRSACLSCNRLFNLLLRLCRDKGLGPFLTKHIERYTCRYGGVGKRKLEIKQKHLIFHADWSSIEEPGYFRQELFKILPLPPKQPPKAKPPASKPASPPRPNDPRPAQQIPPLSPTTPSPPTTKTQRGS